MVDYNFSLQALEGVHQPMVTVTKVLRGLAAVLVERLFTGSTGREGLRERWAVFAGSTGRGGVAVG